MHSAALRSSRRGRGPAAILFAVLLFAGAPAAAQQAAAETGPRPECWRGFGYLLDGAHGSYTSQAMLMVTIGTHVWAAGRPVQIFLNAHGRAACGGRGGEYVDIARGPVTK